ncbi:heat shock transcription factor B3 [Actinidia rufa]|uniref:Heat shock transcription factor B3 n=1 Tax=Actinidia rufa TaxID=165716 RepID=A0A7J0FC01_9ERIC|nr:heat shock transcription factor B3 [Actinidia rufa]
MEFNESENGDGLVEYVMMRKSSPPPFLLKTYMLVEDPETDPVVSWNANGTRFRGLAAGRVFPGRPPNPLQAQQLLQLRPPAQHLCLNLVSLNQKGFRKAATSRWEFCNDMFRKGERDLLCEIRRRKAWANKPQPAQSVPKEFDEDQRSSSTSLSSGYSTLMDENKRLRKENGVLNTELSSMRRKCKELLDLVAVYAVSEKEEEEKRR